MLSMVLLFSGACKGKKDPPAKAATPPVVVDVIVADTTSIQNLIEANGTVLANESVQLHPEVTGRLIYLNVPEGSFVTKGTVLARVNDADLRAQVNKSSVQLELANQTEQRLRKLLSISGVNQADYDAALNQVNSLKADIEYTNALIDKTVIRAPFNGVLGLRQVSPGAYVSPTDVIATLQELQEVKIDFTLPEIYGNTIKKGNTVDVEVDAATQTRRKAVIIATEPQVNQSTRNLKVRAILQQGKGNPGAFVKVYVNSSLDKHAIMVPSNAIIPNDKSDQLILVKKGKADFVDVETGMRQANNVEVTRGVQRGDTVVVTGVLFARPKGAVKIRKLVKLAPPVQTKDNAQ